jgi:hypothetical protein
MEPVSSAPVPVEQPVEQPPAPTPTEPPLFPSSDASADDETLVVSPDTGGDEFPNFDNVGEAAEATMPWMPGEDVGTEAAAAFPDFEAAAANPTPTADAPVQPPPAEPTLAPVIESVVEPAQVAPVVEVPAPDPIAPTEPNPVVTEPTATEPVITEPVVSEPTADAAQPAFVPPAATESAAPAGDALFAGLPGAETGSGAAQPVIESEVAAPNAESALPTIDTTPSASVPAPAEPAPPEPPAPAVIDNSTVPPVVEPAAVEPIADAPVAAEHPLFPSSPEVPAVAEPAAPTPAVDPPVETAAVTPVAESVAPPPVVEPPAFAPAAAAEPAFPDFSAPAATAPPEPVAEQPPVVDPVAAPVAAAAPAAAATPAPVAAPAAAPAETAKAAEPAAAKTKAASTVPTSWFLIALSVASAMTIVALYQIFGGSRAHQLESLPDVKPRVNAEGKVSLMLVPEDAALPPYHALTLGKPIEIEDEDGVRYGNVNVKAVKVTREPVEFVHYKGTSPEGVPTPPPTSPVLKLWLKITNVSKSQTFAPLDVELIFRRDNRDISNRRANNFVCGTDQLRKDGERVLLYRQSPDDEWELKGQPGELKPGESKLYYLATNVEGVDELQGDLVWRVHFRKGLSPKNYGVTTLIDVLFNSKDIVEAG